MKNKTVPKGELLKGSVKGRGGNSADERDVHDVLLLKPVSSVRAFGWSVGSFSMQSVRKVEVSSPSSLVILHSSNAQSRLRPNTNISSDMDARTGKYVPPLVRLRYESVSGHHPESLRETYAFDLASDPIDQVKCLVMAKERPVRQKHDKAFPYDLYQSLERRAFLSFELQLNCWERGRVMTSTRCEVRKADFQASFSTLATKNSRETRRGMYIQGNTTHDITETAKRS
jgi:hypothetical protein